MNILEQAKQFAEGAKEITDWLGDGGHVVDQVAAQERASTCLTCAKNVPVGIVKDSIAAVTRKTLEIKNKLGLHVLGEKSLGQCEDCGCVLRLLIWEPQSRIEPFIDEETRAKLPTFCWKLRKTE